VRYASVNQMKIGILGLKGLPSKGGAERVAEAVVRRLADRHDFTVYCDRRYTPPESSIPRVRLVRLPTFRGKHSRMLCLDLLSAAHALARGKYDLVHVHSAENGFVNPLLWLRFRVVGTVHTQAYTADKWGAAARLCMRLADIPFLRFSDSVTCVNGLLQAHYGRSREVHLIPNGVDVDPAVDVARAHGLLKANSIAGPPFILFAAARIIPFKGCHLLLRAFHETKADIPLVIVGDLDQVPRYRREIEQLADRRVRFIPFVGSQAELLGLVKQARLFTFPSTNKFGMEGMSMMLLEAASLGTPVLCSDIPQNTAVLGDSGYYFASDNVADLQGKLEWALAHPGEMSALASRAQSTVRKEFSWDSIAERYEELYEAAVSTPRGKQRPPAWLPSCPSFPSSTHDP
jgi:glycosyltransferase involved in cell wall biosynthesis